MNIEDRFWSKVDKAEEGCWNWTAATLLPPHLPYGRFSYEGGKHVYAHRFSWELHHGRIPKGKLVLHRCDNPRCVRPEHLFLGTHLDNMRDKIAKGRVVACPGEKNGQARLSLKDIKAIRELHSAGLSYKKIAPMFGISFQHVGRIVNRVRWRQG